MVSLLIVGGLSQVVSLYAQKADGDAEISSSDQRLAEIPKIVNERSSETQATLQALHENRPDCDVLELQQREDSRTATRVRLRAILQPAAKNEACAIRVQEALELLGTDEVPANVSASRQIDLPSVVGRGAGMARVLVRNSAKDADDALREVRKHLVDDFGKDVARFLLPKPRKAVDRRGNIVYTVDINDVGPEGAKRVCAWAAQKGIYVGSIDSDGCGFREKVPLNSGNGETGSVATK